MDESIRDLIAVQIQALQAEHDSYMEDIHKSDQIPAKLQNAILKMKRSILYSQAKATKAKIDVLATEIGMPLMDDDDPVE